MVSGMQLGKGLQGASEGFRRIDQRKDQQQQRKLRGLQIEGAELGLEETQTRVNDKARMREGMEAIRSFMTGGDTQTPVSFMNKYSPEGVRYHNLEPTKDGKYEVVVERDGKLTKDVITQDDVGQSLMLVAHTDPATIFQQQRAEKLGAEAKAEERQYQRELLQDERQYDRETLAAEQEFDMEKMREEYRLKGSLERLKMSGEKSGDNRKISNDLWSRAAKGRGLDMDSLDFNSKNGMMAAYDAHMSSVIYDQVGNTNDAHLRAKSIVNKISGQIDERLDAQGLTGEQRDKQYQTYMDRAINAAARKVQSSEQAPPKKGLDKEEGTKTGRRTDEGREVVSNEDGSVSTERTITVTDPRINNGKPTNIPSIFDGKQVSQEEAIKRIAKAGGKDPETGRQLKSYKSIDEAVAAAKQRSEELGKKTKPKAEPKAEPKTGAKKGLQESSGEGLDTVQQIRDWFDKKEYLISGKGKVSGKRAEKLAADLQRRLQSLTPKQRKMAEAFIEKHKKSSGLMVAENAQK